MFFIYEESVFKKNIRFHFSFKLCEGRYIKNNFLEYIYNFQNKITCDFS